MPIEATRRGALLLLGAAALGCRRAAAAPADGQTDQAFMEALANRGGGTVAARARPYRLTAPVALPAGCALAFEPGASVLWDAPPHRGPRVERGVFLVEGDGVTIGSAEAGVTVRAARPDTDLFAVLVRGRAGTSVLGVTAVDCGHVFATSRAGGYAEARLSGPGANGCRALRVEGGGAAFAEPPADPHHGACTIQYADGFTVRGCRYRDVAHGVQWWGGDADPSADGALGRERKCRNGLVEDVRVDRPVGCSVWGSMGQGVRVRRCSGTEAGDVGFDAEGSVDVGFDRCVQRGAKRGCFSTFFLNRGIVFRECEGVQPAADRPLFRIHTEVLGENGDVSILGGRFACLGREPSTIDDAYGDAGAVTIRGAELNNVRIAMHHREHARVVIEGNRLSFPGGAGAQFDAVLVGVPVARPGFPPTLRVVGNRIASASRAPGRSAGVRVLRNPGQPTRTVTVSGNDVSGFDPPLDAPGV